MRWAATCENIGFWNGLVGPDRNDACRVSRASCAVTGGGVAGSASTQAVCSSGVMNYISVV